MEEYPPHLPTSCPSPSLSSKHDLKEKPSQELQSIHVGNTKPQSSALSPDLPIALTTLLITAVNLTSPLPFGGFFFAFMAFILSFINALSFSGQTAPISRPTTVILLTTAYISLLLSRTAVLGGDARVHIPLSENIGWSTETMAIDPVVKQSTAILASTHRMLVQNEKSVPVNALKAVERSQQALPNAGDSDTEAHENSLDETRITENDNTNVSHFDREMGPPNLNGTFIVNTNRAESW